MTANLPLVDAFAARFAGLVDWSPPDGGCVAFPRHRGADGVERRCAELVQEEGVLLLPASIFRSDLTATSPDRFRLGIGRRDVGEGLARWAEWLDRRADRDTEPGKIVTRGS